MHHTRRFGGETVVSALRRAAAANTNTILRSHPHSLTLHQSTRTIRTHHAPSSSPSPSPYPPNSVGVDPSHPLFVRTSDPHRGARDHLKFAFRKYTSEAIYWITGIVGVVGGIYLIDLYMDRPFSLGSIVPTPDFGSKNRYPAERPTTRLAQVVGCEEAKAEVIEVIEFLKNPAKFNKLGGRIPKGVLLLGPPGVGKTLLARAIAGEAGVPFFSATGADFEEMYLGVGASRVRDLFAAAKKHPSAIIFIDEIDTVGGKRNPLENPKARLSLNQLLTELDGFQETSGIIVIGATNFEDKLDSALLRPGRFDRHVNITPPDIKGRKEILDLYAQKIKLDPSVDLNTIARGTPGLTGADLFQLLNAASLRASTLNKPSVDLSDLEHAKDRILMGSERVTAKNPKELVERIAVYEGGKSLITMLTPSAVPLHKVTVIQRGTRLGKTTQQRASNDDQTGMSYLEYVAMLDVLIAGRVAEELVYGADNVTTVAGEDLTKASSLARNMVSAYGYSDRTGVRSHARTDFASEASNATKLDIDEEVKKLLSDAYTRVRHKLEENRRTLTRVSKELLEREVLDRQQLKTILEGGTL